jgi:hypothetical protein
MSYTWQNDPTVAGYVIALGDTVGTNHEKNWRRNEPRYIVAIPNTMVDANLTLELPKQLERRSLDSLLRDGTVMQVLTYDGSSRNIELILRDLDVQWWYGKVAPLKLNKE